MKKMALYAFVCGFFACTCDLSIAFYYHHQGIADDDVAASIRPPGRPTSVSEIIEKIKQTPSLGQEIELDLSSNNIGNSGAMQLLDFITKGGIPRLQKVNFSYNRITEDKELTKKFLELLRKPNIRIVNVYGNYCATSSWVRSLGDLGGEPNVMKKLIWLSDEMI